MDHKANKMLIDASHQEETRVVVLRDGRVEEFDFESVTKKPLRGNIYLAKVTRVEPSLQACFVEYGGNRHGFLAFSEIHPDYYQIPMADRQALLDEEMEAEREAEQEADERAERMATRRNRNGDSGHGEQPGDQPTDQAGDQSGEQADDQRDAGAEDHTREHTTVSHAAERAESTGLQDPVVSTSPAHDDDNNAQSGDAGRESYAAHDQASHDHASRDEGTDYARHHSDGNGHGERQSQGHIEDIPSQGDEQPETIAGSGDQPNVEADVAEEMPERPRRQRRKSYKIQEVIKRRQVMLIQVVKEERGTKGAALTTYLSLAGRYTVLMPNTGRGGGISRKITQVQDRKRLKEIAQELEVPEGMGLIIRTAGASRSMQEVRRDYEYLMRLWESVRDLTLASTAPSLVYEEGSLIKRAIRDLYTKEIDEIVVSGDDAHREAQDFMRMLMPSHVRNVIKHESPRPLFSSYPQADRQLSAMFSPSVPLPSGGYLVINQTEALVAIDINSGRSTREYSIEDTALKTNLEAADEIARQLKLRDLAGLIVIDFIDMEEKRNNRAVERRLKDALQYDRARLQVGRISHFGLLEMSRQRMRTGVLEGSTTKCPHCEGTGIVRSVESISLAVLRGIEDHLGRDSRSSINVLTQADVGLYILNHKRAYVMDIERRYGIAIALLASEKMQGANFAIERSAVPVRREPERAAVNMNMGFDGAEPPIEEDVEEAPARQPLAELEEVADDSDEPRDHEDRSGGPRPNGERREARDRDGHRDGDGRRRRRRRGRGRGERGFDREQPREDAGVAGDAGLAAEASTLADFDGEIQEDREVMPVAGHAPDGDDAPELINGDGEDGPRADAGADGDDARRGKRRRRGRRGGRRNPDAVGIRAEGAPTDVGPEHADGGEQISATADKDANSAAGTEAVYAPPFAPEAELKDLAEHQPLHVVATQMAEPTATQSLHVLAEPATPAHVAEVPPAPPVAPPPASSRRADAPLATEPEIVSDAPARPARKGWWKTGVLG